LHDDPALRAVRAPFARSLLLRGALAAACALPPCVPAYPAAPPPAVMVAPVAVKNVAPAQSYIGHVIAIQSVKIVPRVTAFIDSVPVQQGSQVKAGQILFQFQKAQYAAAVQSAQAGLVSARAALAAATLAYQRAQRLNQQGFEAASALDRATATYHQDQAAVQSAEADLAQAGLNLGYCTITSPIAGRIGAVTLTKGNLVTPSTPALATVNQLDPIRVVFSVPYSSVVRAEQKTGTSPSATDPRFAVRLTLPDGAPYAETGKIAFEDNRVDTATGTVSVYADFPNPKGLLLPGAYVSVVVRPAKPEERVLVPVEAVQTDRSGSSVLLVGADHKVKQQPVTLGPQIGQSYVVEKGLAGGESVIVAGVQKVKPGQTVNPVPAAPPPQAASGAAG